MKVRNAIAATSVGVALFAPGYLAAELWVPDKMVDCEEGTEGQWVSGGAGPAVASTYVEGCEAGEMYATPNPVAVAILLGDFMLSTAAGLGVAAYLEDRARQVS